jgi:hypothetical protein
MCSWTLYPAHAAGTSSFQRPWTLNYLLTASTRPAAVVTLATMSSEFEARIQKAVDDGAIAGAVLLARDKSGTGASPSPTPLKA